MQFYTIIKTFGFEFTLFGKAEFAAGTSKSAMALEPIPHDAVINAIMADLISLLAISFPFVHVP